jgi:hypothetical protein
MGEKLSLVVDIYSPQYMKTLKFTGNYPSRVLKMVPTLIKNTFRITSTNFYEDEIKWDKTTSMIDFFGQWRGRDPKDTRTNFWILVKVAGEQDSTDKDKRGSVTISIHPYMKTNFGYDNSFQRAIIDIYAKLFYKKRVRKYVERQMFLLNRFENALKGELGLK